MILSSCLLAACDGSNGTSGTASRAVAQSSASGSSTSTSSGNTSTSSGSTSTSSGSTAASATGTATLSWSPPLTNADGSMLTDLAGYHVYYGTDPNNFTKVATVANASQVVFTASNLTAGTWYFAITSYNSSGIESQFSAAIATTIT